MKTFNMHVKTVILTEQNKILLLKHKRSDRKELWDLPGSTFTKKENFDETVITEVQKEIGYYIYLGKIMGVTNYKNNKTARSQLYVIMEGNILHGELKLSEKYDNYAWVDINWLNDYPLVPWLSNYIQNNKHSFEEVGIEIQQPDKKNGEINNLIPEDNAKNNKSSINSEHNNSNTKNSLEILKETIIRTLHPQEVKSNNTKSKNKKIHKITEKKEKTKITEKTSYNKSYNNKHDVIIKPEQSLTTIYEATTKKITKHSREKHDEKKITSIPEEKTHDMNINKKQNLKKPEKEPKITLIHKNTDNHHTRKEKTFPEKTGLSSEKTNRQDWKEKLNKNSIKNPKISVIIPSLNVKPYIKECIESVLNQTLTEIEIICIDSGSNDGTLEILEEYSKKDSRISLLKSDVKSYGKQVNIGLSLARGDYISIIETDDYIEPDMLKKLYDLSENDTIDIIKGNFYNLDDTNSENPVFEVDNDKIFSDYNGEKFKLEEHPQFLNGHPSIWAAIYKKQFLEENQITFLEEPGGGWVDNVFFYQTAIKAQSIKYIDTPLYYYRKFNPDSSSNNLQSYTIPMKRILNIFDLLDEYEYRNRDVYVLLYNRLFRYIEIILENIKMDITQLTHEEKEYIYAVLQKVDDTIVSREMILNFQKIYYKYKSPLFLEI